MWQTAFIHDDETVRPETNVVNTEYRNVSEWKIIKENFFITVIEYNRHFSI